MFKYNEEYGELETLKDTLQQKVKERTTELEEKNKLIERNAHEKTMFFINLSHEIKTPLTLAENYLEQCIKEFGENKSLMIVKQNIQKMHRDILAYMNVENIERGGASYQEQVTISLSKFLEEKINLFVGYATHKGIELNYTIGQDVYVKTNPKGIEQVIDNLIENAIKYTPEHGKITVSLEANETKARFSVQNSGVLIPAGQLKHLFEPFHQLSNEKQNIQGVGMGLYIVKKILDETDGHIEVNSSQELGVIFTVTFPLGVKNEAIGLSVSNTTTPVINPTIPKATDSPYEIDKPCLLLVEDNNELLGFLVNELRGHYNIFVADNGLSAIRRLEKIPVPELIISDIMMDIMDGYELLEKTLANEKFAHIPFIFLTAKNTPQEKITGLDSGALDFISKPFSIDEVKTKVKTIIAQKSRISEAAIREIKKQFSEENQSGAKQRNEKIFNDNVDKYKLSAREKDVIEKLREGLTYKEIGEKLFISERTVVNHIQSIYSKTGVNSQISMLNKVYSLNGE
jgi:two-component system, sensor histidine kinase ChiS